MRYLIFTSIVIIFLCIFILYISNVFQNAKNDNNYRSLYLSITFGICIGLFLVLLIKFLLSHFGYCKPKSKFNSWNPYS